MNDNDTSDEAYWKFYGRDDHLKWETPGRVGLKMWREAVRRCEESANEVYRANEIKWMNIVSKLRNETEERERKAFEEGYLMRKKIPPLTPDEAYRAFKEA